MFIDVSKESQKVSLSDIDSYNIDVPCGLINDLKLQEKLLNLEEENMDESLEFIANEYSNIHLAIRFILKIYPISCFKRKRVLYSLFNKLAQKLEVDFYKIDDLDVFDDPVEKVISVDSVMELETLEIIDRGKKYLEFAALNRAYDCFEFLVKKGFTIDKNVLISSIMGGDKRIIDSCKMVVPITDDLISVAIDYHNHGVVDEILDMNSVHRINLKYCTEKWNIRMMIYFVLNMPENDEFVGNAFFFFLDNVYLTERYIQFSSKIYDGLTSLHIAILNDNYEVVKLLIEAGQSPKAFSHRTYKEHNAVLELSCMHFVRGDFRIVDLLLQSLNIDVKGTNVVEFYHTKNIVRQQTPAHIVAKNGNLKLLKYLKDKGANLDLQAENGNTCLTYAAYYGHYQIVEYLIGLNVNINSQGSDERCELMVSNKTALIFSIEQKKVDCAKLLIRSGSDINTQTSFGSTPLSCAKFYDVTPIVDMLNQKGAPDGRRPPPLFYV